MDGVLLVAAVAAVAGPWALIMGAVLLFHRQIDQASDWVDRHWPLKLVAMPAPSAVVDAIKQLPDCELGCPRECGRLTCLMR